MALSQEVVADRLLAGSVKRSYDPAVDIDWDAPLDPDKLFLPAEVITLYGTPLWDKMTHEQRRELSRQELANVLSTGIWFENVLNRILLRELLSDDPTTKRAHYTLTEMGDETRHMVMFGRVIDRIEARPYWPRRAGMLAVRLLPLLLRGPMVWTGALIGEEIFDALQRRTFDDPQLQPLVARTMRIHVTEEARHIGFARDALARTAGSTSRPAAAYARLCVALAAPFFVHMLTNRHMYARAGLDGRTAKRMALTNPNSLRARAMGAESLAAFLTEIGFMGPLGRWSWRRWGLAR